jgi:phosphopantetheine adenylyltransferase
MEIMALKQKLEMASMEVRFAKELLYAERNQYENRIKSLEDIIGKALQNDRNVNISVSQEKSGDNVSINGRDVSFGKDSANSMIVK